MFTKEIYHEWFKTIKSELLKSEPQNIRIRANCSEGVINNAVTVINTKLGFNQLTNHIQYQCKVNTPSHLQFLVDWPGLRISPTSSKAPRSRSEYAKKSKNWLNGRRAPNYSKTLFPFFIHDAARYTHKVSQDLIPINRIKQSLYSKILLYKILAGLCGSSVSFNDQAKKAPFFCKNSVERKGKLRDILQSYAVDHQYVHGFPSCAEEAVDYFESKSTQYFNEYQGIKGNNVGVLGIYKKEDDVINKVLKEEEKKICSEHWRLQSMELQRQIDIERRLRVKAEAERDRLQTIFNLLNNNTNKVTVGSLGVNVPHSAVALPPSVQLVTNVNNRFNPLSTSLGIVCGTNNYQNIGVNYALNGNSNNRQNVIGQQMTAALFDMFKTI